MYIKFDAVFFISHDKDKTFKREDGTEYNMIIPSCPSTCGEIIKNMVDIMAYAHQKVIDGVPKRILTFRSLDGTIDCKSRFRYMPPAVELSYENLVKALNEAIDMEAQETEGKFITNERNQTSVRIEKTFEQIMNDFNEVVNAMMTADANNAAKITATVERYLGKGKKVAECTERQAEIVSLITEELKSLN